MTHTTDLNNLAERAWALDYIDDAATARVTYRWNGREYPDNSNYYLPDSGIHLCGQTDDGEQPTSVARYEMPDTLARKNFELAKVAECSRDEADFLVDLCVNDGVIADFWSNRQLWPRAIDAWNVAASLRAMASGQGEGV